MTVSSSASDTRYSGNGVTVAFSSGFTFFASSTLRVSQIVVATGVETVKTMGPDYSVTGGAGAIGTVTMAVAPPSGQTLVIKRNEPYTQLTDLQQGDPLPADVLESSYDKLEMQIQQVLRLTQTSIQAPASFDPNTTVPYLFPAPASGQVLSGRADLLGWENALLGTLANLPTTFVSLTTGDIIRYDAAGGVWRNLAIGSTGQYMVVTGGLPSWKTLTLKQVQQVFTSPPTTVTVTIANPAVMTWAAHGLPIGGAFVPTTSGALPTGMTAGNTYFVIAAGYGAGSFQFSATAGGAAIVTTGSQSGVHTGTPTYVPTTGMIQADLKCWGGGGGGGNGISGANLVALGSGGGSGAYSQVKVLAAAVGVSKLVTLGLGGTGAASGGANAGGTGGDTSVGALCVAKGGIGGPGLTSTTPFPSGGAGGAASAGTGDFKLDGNAGDGGSTYQFAITIGCGFGGNGAGAPFIGYRTCTPAHSASQVTGVSGPPNSGSGGTSGFNLNGTNTANAGAGGSGRVVIDELILVLS